MGKQPTCLCGHCRNCWKRLSNRAYYRRHAVAIIHKNNSRRAKRAASPEVSDEELDRRALITLQS